MPRRQPSEPDGPWAARPPAAFLRIGHRGAAAERPENTLASFRCALEHGAQMIECDLQLTSDGHVVIFHDFTLERTTNGSGVVTELPLASLRRLDAGAWRGAEFVGERVPTLAETLDLVLPAAELNLELKLRPRRAAGARGGEGAGRLAAAAVAAVAERRAFARVVFSSFDRGCIEALREASPQARIGVLWDAPPFAPAFALAAAVGAVALHPRASTVTPALVGEAHERGLLVYVWTVNALDEILRLVRAGVDGVISDHPGRLLEARDALLAT